MIKKLLCICLLGAAPFIGKAQELNARITINSDKVQSTNKQVFKTLQDALNDFVNNKKWTDATFAMNERIDCSMTLIINEMVSDNSFKGEIQVQARRPVYNSSYTTTLLNYRDTELSFDYTEFEPLEYTENTLNSNLIATVVFYIYTILGLDFDSFSPKGGTAFLEQAMQQIIAPTDATHKPLGNSSARECLSMLRRICKYAAHLRLIRPMELEVALPKAVDKTPVPLSPAEQQRLYHYVQENPTPRKIGLLLGLELGLRIGEICGLQWGDFDLKLGTLKINRTVCRISCGNGHTKVVIQTPKTRTSRREIPIPKQLLIMLKRLRGNTSNSTWLLSGTESKPTEPRCYRKSIKAYLKQATVRQVRPHALRHTFATTCLQAGCDVKTLSELLGHANANITLQRYVHSDLTRKRREMNRIFSHQVSMRGRKVLNLME